MRKILSGIVLALALVIGVVCLFEFTVTQQRVLNTGTDEFGGHHALYGSRVKSQTVSLEGKLLGAGFILVDLHRAGELTPVEVEVRSLEGGLLEEEVIPAEEIVDDKFEWVTFSDIPEQTREVRFDVQAPNATRDTAVGLRFDRESDDKHLALAVRERTPLWWQLRRFVREEEGVMILRALGMTLFLVLIMLIPTLKFIPSHFRRNAYIYFLLVVFLLAIFVRLDILRDYKGVSGGDPYNYLSITKQLTESGNPFVVDKRLPGWPLLMVPAFLSDIDDIWWMQFLSILSAGGVVVLVSLLARSLRLPWGVQIAAPVLLAWQKEFFLVSLRPEPYTFYTFLLLAALLLFQYLDRKWAQIVFGAVLGFAAMTRQEGFVLAAVLGLCVLPLWKKLWWRGYLRIFVPAFLLVLPFFAHNTLAYGNPIYTPYFEGGRNELVDSWNMFKDRLGATWGVLGALWRVVWDRLFRVSLSNSFFLSGFSFVFLWWGLTVKKTRKLLFKSAVGWWGLGVLSVALITVTLWTAINNAMLFGDSVMKVTAGILLASVFPFLGYTKWRGVPIVLVLVTQTMIALWFHPFPKHYQQDYPLIMLLVASALFVPLYYLLRERGGDDNKPGSTAIVAASLYRFAVLAPFLIVVVMLFESIVPVIDERNEKTAVDYVIYQAVQKARQLPGPHGFDKAYQSARLYFSGDGFYYEGDLSLEEQQAWIQKHGIRTMVVTNLEPVNILPRDSWHKAAHIKSEGKNEVLRESRVFEIPE